MKTESHRVLKVLAFVVPAVVLVGFLSMPKEEYPADPVAVRCETVSLINSGSLEIPKGVADLFKGARGQYFFENSKHKLYSKFGIMNGLINIPPLLIEKWCDGSLTYLSTTRVIYLNIFNLILSAASAVYLCLIVSRYTRSALVVTIFVLTAFYCTYWWNYLRAQNSEIYQTLFMLALFYHLTSCSRPSISDGKKLENRLDNRHLIVAGFFFGTLILVKVVYVILIPILVAWIICLGPVRAQLGLQGNVLQICAVLFRSTAGFIIPVTCAVFALLMVNAYKFDSPFETGYSQWGESQKPILSGNFFGGLYDLLFYVQGSIFICFPLLIGALFGYPRFFRNYRADALLFLMSGIVLFLIYAKMLNPLGRWCYGPRYMIVLLPLLSLPFVTTLEFLFDHMRRWWAISALVVIAFVLSYSFELQLNVNAFPFFTYFRVQRLFSNVQDPAIDRYLNDHSFGTINGEIIASKKGRSFVLLDMAAQRVTYKSMINIVQIVNQLTPSNYYWWP